jgi:hypothetical protein
MLDDIGLGNAIANFIYIIIFIIGLSAAFIFLKRKNFVSSIFCLSVTINLFFYLYLMGNYRFYPKFFYSIVNSYWPLINIGLLSLLIVSYIKNKRKKIA